ncbi:MAG TPA: M48 family metallopeptidase [Aestuariivirgaceae bacterium]|jgi:heat shock protein HtpX
MFKAYGLYTHIQKNRLKSLFLLASFVLLIHAVLFSLLLIFQALSHGGSGQEILEAAMDDLRYAWPAGVVAALLWFAIAFFFHQRMIDFATRAEGIARHDAPELYNALENLCISRGIPMPRLKIIETEALNAFASGIRRGNYSVAVTRGLVNSLSERELECVLAHELTHIRNKDTQMMVIAVIFAGIIAFVGDVVFRRIDFPFGYSPQPGWSQRRSSGKRGQGGAAAIIILIALAVIAISWGVSVLIRLALSRSREFLADAGAVELTKEPDAMISALRRIEGQAAIPGMPSRMHAFFFESPAVNPLRGWLATHPSVEDRVAALVNYAGGSDLALKPLAVETKGPWG